MEGNIAFAIVSTVCTISSYLGLLVAMGLLSWWLVRKTALSLQEGIAPMTLIKGAGLAQIVTLFHETFFPGHGNIAVIFGYGDAYVRGWPFAWLGLASSWESLLIPFYVLANWLVWITITCLVFYIIHRFAPRANVVRFSTLLALLVVNSMAVLLPLVIAPINSLGD